MCSVSKLNIEGAHSTHFWGPSQGRGKGLCEEGAEVYASVFHGKFSCEYSLNMNWAIFYCMN